MHDGLASQQRLRESYHMIWVHSAQFFSSVGTAATDFTEDMVVLDGVPRRPANALANGYPFALSQPMAQHPTYETLYFPRVCARTARSQWLLFDAALGTAGT